MSAHLQLPADLLDDRRPLSPQVDGELRSTILQLAQLVDRGECLDAAQQAVELLRADVYDLRLACVYMVGLFVERGLPYLPTLLRDTQRLVDRELASPPALRSAPRVLDTTVQWMLQTVSTHVEFHVRQRDETWKQWLRGDDPQLPATLGERLDGLAESLSRVVEQPAALGVLLRLGRWARGDLARAMAHSRQSMARAEAEAQTEAQTESAPEPPAFGDCEPFDESELDVRDAGSDLEPDSLAELHDTEPGADFDPQPYEPEPDFEPDFHRFAHEPDFEPHGLHEREPLGAFVDPAAQPPGAERPRVPSGEAESPALTSLRRKIAGFERLVQRGELAKAAIVARDVQSIVDGFDPVEFLPSLFAGYFRLMSQRAEQLRPHLDDPDDTPWKALSRFYQADLDGFLED
ncbi:MAG: type VI secretion system protein IglI family protein [Nannocystaceae bacterium]